MTAASFIRASMQDLGVLGAGEAADGAHMTDALRRLQFMITGWAFDPLCSPQTQRYELPVTPGKGTYTIGGGGDFAIERPEGQQAIAGAGLLLMNSTPPVEIPRSVLTYDAYQRIAVKTLTSAQFTTVFYRPGAYSGTPITPPPPGTVEHSKIILWPIPTEANPLVLYVHIGFPQFQDLTTEYPIPQGFGATIQHNLTLAIAPMFQVEPTAYTVRMAAHTLAGMKRSNYQFIDVPLDPMFTFGSSGGYDIQTGGTTRRG